MKWYQKYTGFPYKHLGNNIETGIDCFNLIKHVYKNERGIEIPYSTIDFCNIVDEDWYQKINDQPFLEFKKEKWGWREVSNKEIQPFDVVIMSIGSTNCVNHCALYVDTNKILHTMIEHTSWIAPYGSYYKQYTLGTFRWQGVDE